MYQRTITTLLLLLACSMLPAQDFIARKRIDSSRGLSNNFVLSLALDGHGYMWVGTESGLNRLDGGSCTVFSNESNRPQGMRGKCNKVQALYYDKVNDQMIIGSERGLNIFDCKKGMFTRDISGDSLITYDIGDIVSDHQQGVWLIYSNGRVQHLDCTSRRITDLDLKTPKGNRSAFDDGKGHLYLGHDKYGMSIVNSRTGKLIRNFTFEDHNPESVPGNNVRRIFQDHDGRIWVGTDHGMALYDPVTTTFHKVKHLSETRDDNVYDICQMADGMLWVASDVGGISIFNPRKVKTGSSLLYEDRAAVELSSFNSRCVIQDDYHNIWVGNHSTGIDFIPSKREFLHNLPYYDHRNRLMRTYAVTNDAQGRLWVSSEDFLSLWNDDHMEGEWKVGAMNTRAHSFARCMMADADGYVWMGMEDEGVIRFNSKTSSFERIEIGYNAPDIHSFMADSDGRIWIGTEYGICIYRQGNITHHELLNKITHKAPATSFIRFSPNEILVSTQGMGICIFNEKTLNHKSLSMRDGLPTNNINLAIYNKRSGLWLASNEGIIHIPDPMKNLKNFEIFNTTNGLIDNQVQAIHEDNEGRIWVSTYRGISCLDTSKHFYNYNQQDGMFVGSFLTGAVGCTAKGDIAFSSPYGVCYFDPYEPDSQSDTAHPRISSCKVYKTSDDLTETVNIMPDEKGRIRLSYQQNSIRIVAAVDNYAQIGNVDYSYMMKGMDNKWYDINGDQDVVFHRLRPGKYTFILRAKLKNQDWEQAQETEMQIDIAPPFWKTWWAYFIYALLFILWIWYIIRSYKRKLALRNSLELERRESLQKQELNEERLRFFTNITHELRTPLTLILGPLEDLKDDQQLSQTSKRRVAAIQKSAERLRNLISEILEFRKTETQNRHLTVARGDLGQFVREICLNYKELNRNPKVQFTCEVAPYLPPVYFDSEVINTILNNLLSNAVKYTEQGCITVNVAAEGHEFIHLTVSDTGYGIAANALPHIFERYYQAEGSHQASGTGIGLALSKSLADLHEATLKVESQEGQGSRFTLSLSINNTYPHALHKEDIEVITTPQDEDSESESADETNMEQQTTLLIVEDNADIRQYIADSFCDDFHILQASNGMEGVQMALENIPDIIVSDIMMPKMNGIELTKQLKEDIRTSHIPIILLTAKSTDEDKETGYDSGADSYLTKPFTSKLLGSRIQNLLMGRRRLAEYIINHPSTTEISPSTDTPLLNRLDKEFLERLNQVIHDNIITENLDIPFLTDKMAMSHSTFYRKVKALTGMTAKEYIRKFRLQHCYQLLESGDYNVTEAAMMTGFNQMGHFRETFKKEFGILPSEVMRKRP